MKQASILMLVIGIIKVVINGFKRSDISSQVDMGTSLLC